MTAIRKPAQKPGRQGAVGIAVRHRKACPARSGGRCGCRPAYQAQVWSPRDNSPIRRSFPTLAAARAWRSEAQVAVRQGLLRQPSQQILREVAEQFIDGARAGVIRNRAGHPYKPSVVRGYEAALRRRVLPELGGRKLSAITHQDVQALVDRMLEAGDDPSTVRNAVMPLRAIYRRAHRRGHVQINPTRDLDLPAPQGRRERVAAPDEARALLVALSDRDQAIWATALYAGLRRGELRALRWEDIRLEERVIVLSRSWDPKAGPVETKTRTGRRTVPIPQTLHQHLSEHHARAGCPTEGWVYTNHAGRPFDPSVLVDRARKAWTAAGLDPIGLHECRHTYASLMIASGANPKELSTYLGHASITITLDRYGHLMPGNEADGAERLDRFLAAAATPRLG